MKKGKSKRPQNKNKKHRRRPDSSDSEDGFEEVNHADLAAPASIGNMGGFPAADENSDDEFTDTRKLVMQQNRKNKKSGGFQSMGLSHAIFKGVLHKGYKIPTPIQRKTIPLIMDGKDVVAMARTGSGKTAAFLIPMFEKLKRHVAKQGARALILSPTRELALQTLKFAKELGKYTGLRSACIVGGDRMEEQFEALHENPDIIIGTPGRFMHVLVEMDLKLQSVEYVVFDEADRLFEMGFKEQLTEILNRLPDSRQTLLFSATLPKLLVEFAKAGLHDPMLLRLDLDTKLSEQLKISFFQCRSEDKLAILLYLLREVVKPTEQTVVFAATKHHVEYLNMILQEAGIHCSYSYSSLDQTARKIHVAKFRNKKTMVLLVTDLAARGIDIPMLDNVINYNFPAKPKLFLHRVGRVARAGHTGTAYSLVSPDELPYVQDLHLFLGRPMKFASSTNYKTDVDGLFGRVPQIVIDDEDEKLLSWHKKSTDLVNLKKVCHNAYKQYEKSRPSPSQESVKRMKEMSDINLAVHPIFGHFENEVEEERVKLLESMRSYKPGTTIFEINSTKKAGGFGVMKTKRNHHGQVIVANQKRLEEKLQKFNTDTDYSIKPSIIDMSTEDDIQNAFVRVVAPKLQSLDRINEPKKKRRRFEVRDEENFLSYRPKDYSSEMGLSMGTSFEKEAAGATLDMTGDEDRDMRKIKHQLKWDRTKKKFVKDSGDQEKKKIRTESGAWISKTYKSNIYKDWLGKSKVLDREDDAESDHEQNQHGRRKHGKNPGRMQVFGGGRDGKKGRFREEQGKHFQKDAPGSNKKKFKGRMELKSKEQILKQRRQKQKLHSFQQHRQSVKQKRRAMAAKKK